MTTNIGKMAGAAALNNQFNSKIPASVGHDEKPDAPQPKKLVEALLKMATIGRSQVKNAGSEIQNNAQSPCEKVQDIENEFKTGRQDQKYQTYMSMGEFEVNGGVFTQNGAKINDKHGYKKPFNGTILRQDINNGTKEYFKFNENGELVSVAKIERYSGGTLYKIDELTKSQSTNYVSYVQSSEEIRRNDSFTMESVVLTRYGIPQTAREEKVYREIPQK